MLLKKEIDIKWNETSFELSEKLSHIGAELLINTIDKWEMNEITPFKQNDDEASYAPIIKKEIGKIDWNNTAEEIRNLIRGTQPWPGTFTSYGGKNLKIFNALVNNTEGGSGKVLFSENGKLRIGTGQNSLDILELQIEGGKRLATDVFLRGNPMEVGQFLGS